MSHALQKPVSHPALAPVLDAHGGDAEAALVACLIEIDRLAALFERTAAATSWGYSRGDTRRTTPKVTVTTETPKPLDL